MKTPVPCRTWRSASCALALACVSAGAGADTPPVFSIDIHTISAGAMDVSNGCFRLSGTIGAVAPGYSSNALYSLYAGFWSAVAVRGVDEIFFSGFEGC